MRAERGAIGTPQEAADIIAEALAAGAIVLEPCQPDLDKGRLARFAGNEWWASADDAARWGGVRELLWSMHGVEPIESEEWWWRVRPGMLVAHSRDADDVVRYATFREPGLAHGVRAGEDALARASFAPSRHWHGLQWEPNHYEGTIAEGFAESETFDCDAYVRASQGRIVAVSEYHEPGTLAWARREGLVLDWRDAHRLAQNGWLLTPEGRGWLDSLPMPRNGTGVVVCAECPRCEGLPVHLSMCDCGEGVDDDENERVSLPHTPARTCVDAITDAMVRWRALDTEREQREAEHYAALARRDPAEMIRRADAATGADEFVVEGLVRGGATTGLVGGPPDAGKTFLVVGMSVALSTGTPFLDRAVRRRRVLYVAGEGTAADIRERVRAYCRHHGIAEPGPEWLDVLVVEDGHLFASPRGVGLVVERAAGLGAGLVVLETVSALWGEDFDDVSQRDVGRALADMKRIAAAISGPVVVTHHTTDGKPRKLRGSTKWKGNTDLVLIVHEGGPLWVDKVRGKRSGYSIPASVEDVPGLHGALDWSDPPPVPATAQSVEERVLEFVAAQTVPVSKTQIRDAVTGSSRSVGEAVDSLTSQSRLARSDRGYIVPSP